MIGRTIGCIAPDPDHVIHPVWSFFGHACVGIHAVDPIEQWRIVHPLPRFCLDIVHIVKIDAIAAFAISKSENQFIVGTAHKYGIGAAILIFADHKVYAFKARDIEWARCAKIDQGIHMHIAAQMNMTIVIDGHGQ